MTKLIWNWFSEIDFLKLIFYIFFETSIGLIHWKQARIPLVEVSVRNNETGEKPVKTFEKRMPSPEEPSDDFVKL